MGLSEARWPLQVESLLGELPKDMQEDILKIRHTLHCHHKHVQLSRHWCTGGLLST